MALKQLEIKRDVEAVAEGIGDGLVGRDCLIFVSGVDANPRCVSVTRRIDALVLVIFPLQGRLPEIAVTVKMSLSSTDIISLPEILITVFFTMARPRFWTTVRFASPV